MHKSIQRHRRRKLQLLTFSTALAIGHDKLTCAISSNSDLLDRCEGVQRDIAGLANLIDIDIPNDVLATLSAYSNVSWNELDDVTKVGLLWVHGYVFSGGLSSENKAGISVIPVYTRCYQESAIGVEMASLGISYDDFAAQCETTHCDSYTNAKCMANVTNAFQCAIDASYSSMLPSTKTASFWSSAASNSTIPYPQIYPHTVTLSDKAEDLQVYSIHMENDNYAGVSCDTTMDAIIPCLRSNHAVTLDGVSDFCKPMVNQTKVEKFLAARKPLLVNLRSGGSEVLNSSSRMALILEAIVTGAFVLIMILVTCCWCRNRKMQKSDQLLGIGASQTTNTHQSRGFIARVMGRRASTYCNLSINVTGQTARGRLSSWCTFGNASTHESAPYGRRSSTAGTWLGGAAGGKTISEYCNESEGLTSFLQHPTVVAKCIAFDELTFLQLLSKGAYGEVWLGQLDTRRVAIKRLLPEKCQLTSSLEQFAGEIQLMCMLQHRNIVSFVGLSWNRLQNLCAVLEYMEAGDLDGVLKKHRDEFSWQREKIAIAMDIAEGLVYLHCLRPAVVHRDLKSKNVLLDHTFHAKLSDFGVSRKTLINETMTSGVGTLLWTAPEIIEGKKYSEKADIYSLGVVLSEMDTCEAPFSNVLSDEGGRLPGMQLAHFVRLGIIRVSLRDDCPSNLRQVIMDCTQLDPDARPSSMQVAFTLKSIIAPSLRMSSSTQATASTSSYPSFAVRSKAVVS